MTLLPAVLAAFAAGAGLALLLLKRKAPTSPAAPPEEAVETARLRSRWMRAEEERERAHAAETLFRRVIDTALDGVAVLDAAYRIEQWNPQAASIFGWSKDEAIGRPLIRLAVAEAAREELHRVISGRARPSDTPLFSRRTEIRGLRRNGQEFPLEIAVTPILRPEKGVAYGVFLRDITERKRVDTLKNEFVATVSHELRTPLTSIRGSLRLIAGGYTGALPEKTRSMIEIANDSCERLVALVNDILDIEKIESGRMSFELRSHDAAGLVAKAVEGLRAFSQPFGVEIQVETPAAPCPAIVDADRVIQVITNLLSNAVKFSPRGGTVKAVVAPRGGRARIEVRDLGPGIPEDFRPRVFQKFAQADASNTRRSAPGTGLGLSICKAIVERLGGAIGFETDPGRGTTFWIELPSEAPLGAAGAPRALLVVESDPAVAGLLSAAARRNGFAPDVAPTAAEARLRLSRGDYAALSLDLELPDADGADFLRELRHEGALSAVPAIVVTERRQPSGRFSPGAGDEGVVDWLSKPLDVERFEAALRSVAAASGASEPADAVRDFLHGAVAGAPR